MCSGSSVFFSMRLTRPWIFVSASFLRPSFTTIRFSSLSFITSPTVAMAASSSISSHSWRSIPYSSKSTWISLYATIAPQISLNGYLLSFLLGLTMASAGGTISSPETSSAWISWWSVTTTVIPSFFASAIWSMAAMPLSQVSIIWMPSAAAFSIICSLIP